MTQMLRGRKNLPTEMLVCRSYAMPGYFSQKEMSLS